MPMPSKTIKSMVAEINNEDADGGGLWLPNIQREFVWSENQIERLFDSVMRQYPLPSMMIWKTKDEIRNRRFISDYVEHINLKTLYRPLNKKPKRLVLDGQQRLQSFFIGLKGSIDGRTLHFNLLSGDTKLPEDIRFRFQFITPKEAKWPWVHLGKIIYSKKLAGEIVKDILNEVKEKLSDNQLTQVTRNIERAKREFEVAEALLYQNIDGTDDDEKFGFEDIVEIFIRANSGGTKLSKSDLMFTLLTSDWDTADIKMQEFLSEINSVRFNFDRDFVLKSSLVLLNLGARYEVTKLRDDKLKKKISEQWDKITESIQFVRDFLVSKTFIRSGKALTSYNALIPLIYLHYHFPDSWKTTNPLKNYLIRALLAGAFSGRPDSLIDKITANIRTRGVFDKRAISKIMQEDGRELLISENSLFDMGYGSGQIHLLFNLWYCNFDYQPALDGHLPQVDHIFPQSLLKSVKDINPGTGRRSLQRYAAWEINQLANCMLLTAKENGSNEKTNISPDIWFKNKNKDYLALHCIPTNKKFWKIENFEKFIDARKKLIREKFAELLLAEDQE
jgi:hypothetical protein